MVPHTQVLTSDILYPSGDTSMARYAGKRALAISPGFRVQTFPPGEIFLIYMNDLRGQEQIVCYLRAVSQSCPLQFAGSMCLPNDVTTPGAHVGRFGVPRVSEWLTDRRGPYFLRCNTKGKSSLGHGHRRRQLAPVANVS